MRTRTRLQFPGFAAIPAQALCHSFLRRKVAKRAVDAPAVKGHALPDRPSGAVSLGGGAQTPRKERYRASRFIGNRNAGVIRRRGFN
jgi:hypothetical protein